MTLPSGMQSITFGCDFIPRLQMALCNAIDEIGKVVWGKEASPAG